MDMQSLPVYQAFYEAYYVGSGWQMPALQMYGV
jgi:hypothetical protein